jgi:hypothetical protein
MIPLPRAAALALHAAALPIPAAAQITFADTTAPAPSPEEAQRLPAAELARRLLSMPVPDVIDVARPCWRALPLRHCAAVQREGPPPVDEFTFFTRAEPIAFGDWQGLCRAAAIHLSFTPDGRPRRAMTVPRIGTAGAIRRAGEATRPPPRPCGALATTRDFVPSRETDRNMQVVVAVELVGRRLVAGATLPCEVAGMRGSVWPCSTADRPTPSRVGIARITAISDTRSPAGVAATDSCFRVTLARTEDYAASTDGLVLCVAPGTGEPVVTFARFRRTVGLGF